MAKVIVIIIVVIVIIVVIIVMITVMIIVIVIHLDRWRGPPRRRHLPGRRGVSIGRAPKPPHPVTVLDVYAVYRLGCIQY